MSLTVIIVHYHTPQLAAAAVAAIRRELAAGEVDGDCVLVDNGSHAGDAETLRALDVAILSTGRNMGYAAGVNRGVRSSHATFVVAMNADVIVQPGCLAALTRELRAGAAAAGPCFSWDTAGRVLLPPTEPRDLTGETLARLSARGPRWARIARARWRRHARRHWTARESFASHALSGALLAFRRDAWERIGPFDEGFQLYFEETDWLRRLQRHACPARYVPSARAHHLFNSSARHEASARTWFAESARRFEDKHYGRAMRWIRRLEPATRAADAQPKTPAARSTPLVLSGIQRRGMWAELSPASTGYPAASERLTGSEPDWRVPADVWDHLTPGRYHVRLVDDGGREHALAMLDR